tara:strand:- start:1951 stop:2337 length:387 start_codon:yes stop_codon:yes gene_type:complete
MKKSELKNMIKECVKEVIFEEGVLSSIITEVVQGVSSKPTPRIPKQSRSNGSVALAETQKRVLAAVGNNSYEDAKSRFKNPELFENTKPIQDSSTQGALSGLHPSDPGLDITNIPGFGAWGRIATGKE